MGHGFSRGEGFPRFGTAATKTFLVTLRVFAPLRLCGECGVPYDEDQLLAPARRSDSSSVVPVRQPLVFRTRIAGDRDQATCAVRSTWRSRMDGGEEPTAAEETRSRCL